MNKKALHEELAEKLISELEKGTSPFQKPWNNDASSFEFPFNPVTNKEYRGVNSLWLMMQNEPDPRWMTFKQAQSKGWNIEKGAKAKDIVFFTTTVERDKLDEKRKPIFDENGKKIKVKIILDTPIISTAKVFNAKHVLGIPAIEKSTTYEWKENENLDQLVKNSGVKISHGGNDAYYSPNSDRIQLPHKHQFPEAQNYYAVLLHEMGHWTGHRSRLNRDFSGGFGTPEYAKEELRAEIASLMIESKYNLPHNFGNHASYVENWIQVLKNDPLEIFKASSDAQKITDYIVQFQNKVDIKLSSDTKENLKVNDQIEYKGKLFLLRDEPLKGSFQVENLTDGQTFLLKTEDRLYSSLLLAKTQSNKPELISKSDFFDIEKERKSDNNFKLKR